MTCPDCGGPVHRDERDGAPVDVCLWCLDLWLEELIEWAEALVERHRPHRPAPDPRRTGFWDRPPSPN